MKNRFPYFFKYLPFLIILTSLIACSIGVVYGLYQPLKDLEERLPEVRDLLEPNEKILDDPLSFISDNHSDNHFNTSFDGVEGNGRENPRCLILNATPDQSADPAIQATVLEVLKKLQINTSIPSDNIAIGVIDLLQCRFGGIHLDKTYYAASFTKVLILLGAIKKASEDPTFPLASLDPIIHDMISRSSNYAATYVGEQVGLEYINRVARKYQLYDPSMNGGLWLGRLYSYSSDWVGKDPLTQTQSHAITARQAMRFWLLAFQGKYINEIWSQKLLEYTANPQLVHKMVRGLHDAGIDAEIWRKSGTYGLTHIDSGIIKTKDSHYIVCYIAQHPNGESIIQQVATLVHEGLVNR